MWPSFSAAGRRKNRRRRRFSAAVFAYPFVFSRYDFFAVPTVGVLTFITDHAGWFSMLLLYPLWRRLAALAWMTLREWLRPTRTLVIRHWRGKPLPQPVVLDLSSKDPLVSQLKKIRQEED